MANQFYTYLYLDPKDGTPRYVGKGHSKRAYSHLKSTKHAALPRMLQKRTREGFFPLPIIHHEVDETMEARKG